MQKCNITPKIWRLIKTKQDKNIYLGKSLSREGENDCGILEGTKCTILASRAVTLSISKTVASILFWTQFLSFQMSEHIALLFS